MRIQNCMTGVAVAALLAVAPAAMAQQGGTSPHGRTSGPAAGSNVEPSTAVQKDNPAAQTNTGSQGSGQAGGQAATGGTSVGAPGVTAKEGTEGGPSPKPGGPSGSK